MRPELLAPAGSPEALRAAAEGGAGAVYLGWGAFNARRGAQNFSQEEFAQAVAWCHIRGVRVFLTLNILLSDRELPEALETARTASRLGVDAVLVQDWGLFDLLRRTLPDLPLHASTQMSVFTSGGACEIAADGCERGTKGPEMLGFRPENAEAAPAVEAPRREEGRVPVRFTCRVEAGKPCLLTAEDPEGRAVTVSGPVPEAARNRALTPEDLAARLGKTGGTPYRCARVDAYADPGLSLSAAAVNALRREALEALSAARSQPPKRREHFPPPPLPEADCSQEEPLFTVSVITAAQLTGGVLDLRPARVYLPLELLADVPSLPETEAEYCAILPRVWRDRDEDLLRRWLDKARALGASGLLLGNLGHFPLARDGGWRLYGDYGLNVFNSRSLDYLREKGLESACLSFELRFSQIRDMKKILPAEAIVYGRLPLMITENCLIQNSAGCRCDRPNFLNDRTGAAFPLLPAFGHRTEVQNSRPLYLADRADWRQLGLCYARLRFTTESPEDCARLCRAYQEGAPAAGEFTRGLYQRGVE